MAKIFDADPNGQGVPLTQVYLKRTTPPLQLPETSAFAQSGTSGTIVKPDKQAEKAQSEFTYTHLYMAVCRLDLHSNVIVRLLVNLTRDL